MPPFEMFKLLLVRVVTDMKSKTDRLGKSTVISQRMDVGSKVMCVDVSKAHLYALMNADVEAYVDLPQECSKKDICGRLNYWLYGMRPASTGWEMECTKQLKRIVFQAGKASPCCFHRCSGGVSVLVHGDDFVFEAPASSLPAIVNALRTCWIIKIRATLGPDASDDKEVSILNRVVRWNTSGIEYEADPRHVEKLLRDMARDNCRELSSLGTKPASEETEKLDVPLTGDAVTLYRSVVPRCNDLNVDRPDIPFVSKELCRAMSRPTESDMAALKHLCRYLKGHPRLLQCTPSSASRAWELQVYVDSDWAGCHRTRKSTNGGCMLLNVTCLKTWSTTQAVRAISSGEAEYYAALTGASMARGFRSMAADLGEDVKIVLRSDSSAALGIGGRPGLGKLRHLETGFLWLQDMLLLKRLLIKMVMGTNNPADLGTKHL